MSKSIWIVRDYKNCSGCRMCELSCSIHRARAPFLDRLKKISNIWILTVDTKVVWMGG